MKVYAVVLEPYKLSSNYFLSSVSYSVNFSRESLYEFLTVSSYDIA